MKPTNQITVLGRIAKAAEVKEISPGKSVINFTVVHSEKYLQGGQSKEKAAWYNCAIFRASDKTGVAPYLKKGTTVYIIGEVSARPYIVEENGEKKAKAQLNILVGHVELCGSPDKNTDESELDDQFNSLPQQGESDDNLPF